MKTKFSRLNRRGIAAVLSVLMALSCFSFGLTSTSAAEFSGSDVSASADSGTVAAQSDSGEVGDTTTYYLLYSDNDSASSLKNSGLEVNVSNDVYTVTIPTTWSGFSGVTSYRNYFFALSSSTSYYQTFFQKYASVSVTGNDASGLSSFWSQPNGEYRMAGVSINPSLLTGSITLTVNGSSASYYFEGSTDTVSYSYTVTAGTVEHGSISPTDEQPITYGNQAEYTATPATGYELSGWTLTDGEGNTTSDNGGTAGGLTLYTAGSKAYVKMTALKSGTATITATFTAKSGDDDDVDSTYHYVQTGDLINKSSQSISEISATFYDYMSDEEISKGWRTSESTYNTGLPYGKLNSALSSYASTNGVAYPLYFGNFDGKSTYNSLINYRYSINNSNGLTKSGSYDKYNYAIMGLAGSTLVNNNITYAGVGGSIVYLRNAKQSSPATVYCHAWHEDGSNDVQYATWMSDQEVMSYMGSDDSYDYYFITLPDTTYYDTAIFVVGDSQKNEITLEYNTKIYDASATSPSFVDYTTTLNSNTTDMVLFNEDWLTDGTTNGSGGSLATIVDSAFPVRVESKDSTTTVDMSKIYIDTSTSSWWTNDSATTKVAFYDSNGTWLSTSDATESSTYSGLLEVSVPENAAQINIMRYVDTVWKNNATSSNITFGTNNLYEIGSNNDTPGVTAKQKPETVTTTGGYNYYTYNSTYGTDNMWFTNYDSENHTVTANYDYEDNYKYGTNESTTGATKGFFPFDSTREGTDADAATDYGFGVKLELEFTLGKNGVLTYTDGNGTSKTVEQEFTYSGDDDLWVYVDDELVLDIGGDHKQSTGTINFAKLTSTVNLVDDYNGVAKTSSVTTNINTDNTDTTKIHKMVIFYMERGNMDSNLQFAYSITPVSNEFDVTNTIDTSSVNSGLKSAVDDEVKGDTFDYNISGTEVNSSTTEYSLTDNSTSSTTSGTGSAPTITGSGEATYVDQFTKNTSMSVKQTPGQNNKYTYTTTNSVNDEANTSGTVVVSDKSDIGTGTFTFLTTKENPGDLDATHLSADYVNAVSTKYVSITKKVTKGSSDNASFTLKALVKLPGATDYSSYELAYSSDAGDDGTTNGTTGEFTISNGETVTFYGIPVGADVQITEDSTASASNAMFKCASIDLTNATDADTANANIAEFGVTDNVTATVKNARLQYRIEYLVPTRLYGTTSDSWSNNYDVTDTSYTDSYGNYKIYALTGWVDSSLISSNNTVDESKFKTLVNSNRPYEDVFDQTMTWDTDDIKVKENGTGSDDAVYDYLGTWKPMVTDYDRYVSAVIKLCNKTYYFNADTATSKANKKLAYGQLLTTSDSNTTGTVDGSTNTFEMTSIVDGDGNKISPDYLTDMTVTDETQGSAVGVSKKFITAPDEYNGQYFQYWKIEKLDSDTGASTGSEVTRCYSNKFVYTMYDSYYITAVYGDTKPDSDTSTSYNSASAYIIDVTRSQWNDTTSHSADSGLYISANTAYDRVYIDFELAYNYNGEMLKANDDSNIKVGFDIYVVKGGYYSTLHKSVEIDKTQLDNRNRMEYYYGIKNTDSNASLTYAIVPYISVDGTKSYSYSQTNGYFGDSTFKAADDYSLAYATTYNTKFYDVCIANAGSGALTNDPSIKN